MFDDLGGASMCMSIATKSDRACKYMPLAPLIYPSHFLGSALWLRQYFVISFAALWLIMFFCSLAAYNMFVAFAILYICSLVAFLGPALWSSVLAHSFVCTALGLFVSAQPRGFFCVVAALWLFVLGLTLLSARLWFCRRDHQHECCGKVIVSC